MEHLHRKAAGARPATSPYVIGDTVPWNTLWSAEREISVRPCDYAGGALATWQPSAQGQGKPVFKTQHHFRQRMCVRLLLCSVCGEHAPPDDRVFFPFRLTDDKGERATSWLMTESPVHGDCAEHAQRVCPFLKAKNLQPLNFPDAGEYDITPIWDEQRPGVVKFLAYKFSWSFVRSVIAPVLSRRA